MGWMIGVLGFDSRRGLGIFLFTTASRPTLGPTQPPIQWVPGILSLAVKRPVLKTDQFTPSNTEVKQCVELYFQSPSTHSWRAAQFKKGTGTILPFTFMRNVNQVNRFPRGDSKQKLQNSVRITPARYGILKLVSKPLFQFQYVRFKLIRNMYLLITEFSPYSKQALNKFLNTQNFEHNFNKAKKTKVQNLSITLFIISVPS
jgi:hypothetical protein